MRKLLVSALLGSSLIMSAPSFAAEAGVCNKAKPTVQAIQANFHANYMPNFIPIVLNNEKGLNLTAEQCQTFNKFQKEKAQNGKKLIKKINQMEAESRQMALKGAPLEELQARHKEIAEAREKLMVGKWKCHQFVKKQLTAEQYDKLINVIYPQMMKKAQAMLEGK